MTMLATAAATAVAAASAAVALGSLLAYLHFATKAEAHAARDEALALAQMRGEEIADLRSRIAALDRLLKESGAAWEARARELEQALAQAEADAREHAYRMQRFYTFVLADLLGEVRADLEADPPNVERPLARLRELLDGERPAA